ncbi:MAG: MATE family efflux transporter [Eubacterium sp.]
MVNDMTRGKPAKILVTFMWPMLLGNIFQQLYNIVDTIIVGNYVGADALAAVGSTAAMVFLLVAIAMGLSMGCSVLISQYFGAGDREKMRRAVFTSMAFILIVGVLVTILGLAISNWLLHLIQTPENIFEGASTYINIYYMGCLFLFVYNGLAAICRAIGDSKTPLYFLIVAALLNVVLDLVFVIYFNMGVAGVAWATLIAQGVSAMTCFIYVYFRVPLLRITKEDCVFDPKMLKDLLIYAIPSTIQQCIVSFSMVAIQGLVNSFGSVFIAGYTAATKIDSIAIQPLLSITMALSTYTAQNMGAGKVERVSKGFKVTVMFVLVMCVIISGMIFLFGDNFIGAFVDSVADAEVINIGVQYIQIVSIFYLVMGLMFTAGSVLRGAGDSTAFMIGSLCNFVVRIISAYVLAGFLGASAIWWSIPLGWFCGLMVNFIRYKSGKWKSKSLVGRKIKLEKVES